MFRLVRHRLILAICLGLVAAGCAGDETTSSTLPGPEATTTSAVDESTTTRPSTTTTIGELTPSRIGIRQVDGDGEFFVKETGERFFARGTNLMFLRGAHALDTPISPEIWDPDWIRKRLTELTDLGYNTIRIFWENCSFELCAAESNGRVRPELLDNATELLKIASEFGVYVWISSNDLPPDSWYSREAYVDGESDFITKRNVEVYREYYADLASGLVERGAMTEWLFAFDLRNEYVYQLDWAVPWVDGGVFSAANGETYDMSDPLQREALSADGIRYWADEMTAVVKTYLPDVLVTMTTLTPNDRLTERGVDDPRWVVVGDFFEESDLDFLNIHGADSDPKNLLWEYVMDDTTKPVVTGEFGLGFGFGSVDIAAWWMSRWETNSCRDGFDGWLTWHWMGDDGRWPGYTPIVAESLAPALHPDPCDDVEVEVVLRSVLGTATASETEASEIDEYLPQNVLDNNEDTWWSAGAGTPQWLELDLGAMGRVGRIRMPMGYLTPSGPAKIEVWGRGSAGGSAEILLHTFEESVAPGDVLEASFEPVDEIQYVRFEFDRFRDWVIIHDLEVWAE